MGRGGNLDKFLLFATRVAKRVVPDTCRESWERLRVDFLGSVHCLFAFELEFLGVRLYCNFSGCFSTKNVAFLMLCIFPNTNSFNLFLNQPPRATLECNQDRIEITQL